MSHTLVLGGHMQIRVYLATRHRTTWTTAAEIMGLTVVLLAVPGTLTRVLGFMLLGHLGYRALTSLPIGSIPGRPDGAKQDRRNQDLRSRVVGFLNEVRRVENFAQQARAGRLPARAVEQDLASAKRRIMAAAAEVASVSGRFAPESEAEADAESDSWIRKLRVHEKVVRAPTVSY